jgi:hypothetical protein
MTNTYKCHVTLGSLLALLGSGCGGDSNVAKQPASGKGGGGAAAKSEVGAAAASGGSGGTKTGAAGSTAGREPTPQPEMPRQLGKPDGIYCESQFNHPAAETCAAGSRCCPGVSTTEDRQVCIADQGKCPACDAVTCAQLLCDGPEDCASGQFCCYSRRTCSGNPDDCTPKNEAFKDSTWMTVACQARCVDNQRDPDHGAVVCKDDHDCPGPYVAGRCQSQPAVELPYGLKVCSGP